MDKTSEISNPTMFENTTGWTVNNIQGTAINNGSYRIQNAAGGQSMTTQTVTGLPAGLYKVTVQSFYRASVLDRCATFGNNGYTFSNAYFKANDNEVLIKDWYETAPTIIQSLHRAARSAMTMTRIRNILILYTPTWVAMASST